MWNTLKFGFPTACRNSASEDRHQPELVAEPSREVPEVKSGKPSWRTPGFRWSSGSSSRIVELPAVEPRKNEGNHYKTSFSPELRSLISCVSPARRTGKLMLRPRMPAHRDRQLWKKGTEKLLQGFVEGLRCVVGTARLLRHQRAHIHRDQLGLDVLALCLPVVQRLCPPLTLEPSRADLMPPICLASIGTGRTVEVDDPEVLRIVSLKDDLRDEGGRRKELAGRKQCQRERRRSSLCDLAL